VRVKACENEEYAAVDGDDENQCREMLRGRRDTHPKSVRLIGPGSRRAARNHIPLPYPRNGVTGSRGRGREGSASAAQNDVPRGS